MPRRGGIWQPERDLTPAQTRHSLPGLGDVPAGEGSSVPGCMVRRANGCSGLPNRRT